ncbi:hypothetical protein [Streptomyces microflavus]|uniref:hypothetical protein n=1 Tax=Streptomyces microflavus TaxID=1919 RepID=UPI002E32A9BA|nr:hypothetical protein [Streptomyces microflavus]
MTTQTETPEPVIYHRIATVQNARGLIATYDGPVPAVPGIHTHTSTYNAVMANLKEKFGSDFGLLFFSLTPDQF